MQVSESVELSPAALRRRAQIVDATVATLAELGHQATSFVEIAKRGGLSSTRLISYHFDGRAELMAEVAAQVVGGLGRAVEARVRAAGSPIAAVRAYIEANLAHMDAHRTEMVALTELLFAGELRVPSGQAGSGVEVLTMIIGEARRLGQLRDVDPRTAASMIQLAVEEVPRLLRERPDLDLVRHSRELTDFFETALARTGVTA